LVLALASLGTACTDDEGGDTGQAGDSNEGNTDTEGSGENGTDGSSDGSTGEEDTSSENASEDGTDGSGEQSSEGTDEDATSGEDGESEDGESEDEESEDGESEDGESEDEESEDEESEDEESSSGDTTGGAGQACDPYLQDCPEDQKCSVFLVNGDWQPPLENVCASFFGAGDRQALEVCEVDYGSPDDIIHDNCAAGLFCSDYDPLPGFGICRPFCTAEMPPCAQGEICHANPDVLPLCRTSCDPQGDDSECGEFEYCANIGGGQGACMTVPAP